MAAMVAKAVTRAYPATRNMTVAITYLSRLLARSMAITTYDILRDTVSDIVTDMSDGGLLHDETITF